MSNKYKLIINVFIIIFTLSQFIVSEENIIFCSWDIRAFNIEGINESSIYKIVSGKIKSIFNVNKLDIYNFQLSPNSKMIAFLHGGDMKNLYIYELNGFKKILELKDVYDYCWATDEKIYYSKSKITPEEYVISNGLYEYLFNNGKSNMIQKKANYLIRWKDNILFNIGESVYSLDPKDNKISKTNYIDIANSYSGKYNCSISREGEESQIIDTSNNQIIQLWTIDEEEKYFIRITNKKCWSKKGDYLLVDIDDENAKKQRIYDVPNRNIIRVIEKGKRGFWTDSGNLCIIGKDYVEIWDPTGATNKENATSTLYYAPRVENLRLRESPDSNSKIIRQLVKGEQLELIEKGKTETIQNKEGTWIKVKSEKGEIGWCFDAYLEEIKKK